jgi:hypothetical protein
MVRENDARESLGADVLPIVEDYISNCDADTPVTPKQVHDAAAKLDREIHRLIIRLPKGPVQQWTASWSRR